MQRLALRHGPLPHGPLLQGSNRPIRLGGRGRSGPRGGFAHPALIALIAALVALFFVHGHAVRGPAPAALLVDPSSLSFTALPDWADPRWAEEFQELVDAWPDLSCADESGLRELVDAIAGLSFVAEVGELSVEHGEIALDVELSEPVACIPSGPYFQLVALDGTILSGAWPIPPRLGMRFLPVIGPLSDANGLFAEALPGDMLAEPEHRAALEMVAGLREHLDESEISLLGRVLIDASTADVQSERDLGILLELERGRTIVFGRSPNTSAPGELPSAAKWKSVKNALALQASGDPSSEWRWLDVRWDRPEIRLSQETEVASLGSSNPSPTPRPKSTARSTATSDAPSAEPPAARRTGPRVR